MKRAELRLPTVPLLQKRKLDLLEGTADIEQWEKIGNKADKMTTALEKDAVPCPHCGAEPLDDDDLCKFCGKLMVPVKSVKSASKRVSSGLRSLKTKIRPMTAEELDEQEKSLAIFDPANPANPIWDE